MLFTAGTFASELSFADMCRYQQQQGNTLFSALVCGQISGSVRTLYYSTHNANFVTARNQDTVSYGG